MPRSTWTAKDIPSQIGKLALVTGANSGIGLETAGALARAGAQVILACRTPSKAEAAIEQLRASGVAREQLEFRPCDLSDLRSVRALAEVVRRERQPLDLLINNAGVMALPWRETAEGFEMQFGTNHLGHFALTLALLDHLRPAARIVTVSSLVHKLGTLAFDNLDGRRSYSKWGAYTQSKLANLLFCFELQRRLEASGRTQLSLAAHPGYAATSLLSAESRAEVDLLGRMSTLGNRLFAQSAAQGALPTLYAATAPAACAGEFYGPDGFQEMWGKPTRVRAFARAHDPEVARRLWEVSVELTGFDHDELHAGS